MKIGEIARRLGTTARTLRFYEERGLVTPRRSERGTRRYDEGDVARFRAVLTLAEAGMALADIEVLTRLWRGSRSGDQAAHRADTVLSRLGQELKTRREGIERLEADLARARQVVARCAGCTAKPGPACRRCPVSQNCEQVQMLRILWEKDAG